MRRFLRDPVARRVLAGAAAALLALLAAAATFVLALFVAWALPAPDALRAACEAPCLEPPAASYGEVVWTTVWALAATAVAVLSGATALRLAALAAGRAGPRARRMALAGAGAMALVAVTVGVAQLVQAPEARLALACEDADLRRWDAAGVAERQRLAHAMEECGLLDGWSRQGVTRLLGPPVREERLGERRTLVYRVSPAVQPRHLRIELVDGRTDRATLEHAPYSG